MRSLWLIGHDFRIQAAVSALFAKDFDVTACSTGREAMLLRPRIRPSLAVVDFSLSEFDRCCALRALRRGPTKCWIVVTAADRFALLPHLARGRLSSVLGVPFRVADLCNQVIALLRPGSEPLLMRPLPTRAVADAIEHISHYFGEALAVSDVAAAACLSTSRLEHVFHERTGQTLKEYLSRVRVEAAKHLLLNTDLGLDGVASAVGFCDASHLSRLFLRCCGSRPGGYRQRMGAQRIPGFDGERSSRIVHKVSRNVH